MATPEGVAVSNDPSPSRSHCQLVSEPSGSAEPVYVNVTGWPTRGEGLTLKDTLAGCWSATTVTAPTMLFGGPKWMAQWKAYVPGCLKWSNVADVPVAVDPGGAPLSFTQADVLARIADGDLFQPLLATKRPALPKA